MSCPLKKTILVAASALAFNNVSFATRAQAQTYQIDCAILLCLSGGWPASGPCVRARAEFIRRITPWPVEPPLQIWRCPMGASYSAKPMENNFGRLFDIQSTERKAPPLQSTPVLFTSITPSMRSADLQSDGHSVRQVQGRADIDISGPEFNFVRSIRVFHVQHIRQREVGPEDKCSRSSSVALGSYSDQGEFQWSRSSLEALPMAHDGFSRWPSNCADFLHRSVFVDWRDFEGEYGFEQVNY